MITVAHLLGAPVALADGPAPSGLARAKALFEKGQVHFNLAEYDKALKLYRDAYVAAPLPGLLFNIGNCYYNLGNHQKALDVYQKYLIQKPDAPNRPDVETLIAKCRDALAPAPPPSESASPASGPVATAPSGSTAAPPADPPATAPAGERSVDPGDQPRPRPLTQRILLWSCVGLTAALLAAGTITGVQSLRQSSEFKAADTPLDRQLSLRDSGETLATISTVSFVGAGVAAAATGLYYWLGYRRPAGVVAVAPAPKGEGLLMSFGGRF